MIRYRRAIELKTNRNGDIALETDMGQTWRTTLVKSHNHFGEWLWSHHTSLREWQKDMMALIHEAYNPEYNLHPIELYWVYQKGTGYQNQSVDIALARIPTKNIWVLMTPQNTWIQENKHGNFSFLVEDSSGPVTDEKTRDEIWNFRDYMRHGRILDTKKRYKDSDYEQKGIAP